MYNLKRFISISALLLFGLSLSGQDIHFSQFYMSPQNLNPAMTGVINCNSRFVANIRNQWASVLGSEAFNTFSVGYDQKLPVGRSDYFGVGGSFFADVAGASRFGIMQGKMSIAYTKKMGGSRTKSHYLSIGAEIGVGQWAIRNGDLRWPSQVNNGVFDPTIPPGQLGTPNFLYSDIGLGILWFSNFDENNSFYVGLAATHLNQPNVSFFNDVTSVATLNSKFTFHVGGVLEFTRDISLVPNVVALFQGPHNQFNLGSSIRFDVGGGPDSQSWQLGAWYRLSNSQASEGIHSDAIIFATRFDTGAYGIGLSYDYNVSRLQEGGALNGSFELSLIYLICGNEKRGVYCPKF